MAALYLPLGCLFSQLGWVHGMDLQFQSVRGFEGWAWCLQGAEMTSLRGKKPALLATSTHSSLSRAFLKQFKYG